MQISRLSGGSRPHALTFPLGEVPHLTLEPTRECNLTCALCYALDRRVVKPLETIRDELDTACRHRRLDAVTLVGGEPTLYPELPDVVRLVKERGLACQLLTNGIRFLPERGRDRLRELMDAGLDKVAFHVDGGQPHADPEAVRRRLFDLCEEEGLLFSLSVTVYPDDLSGIADAVRRYARYRHFDGVLAVLGRDPGREDAHGVRLDAQHGAILDDLGVHPVSYVPSNRDPEEAFWLVYSYFIRGDTGRVFGISPGTHGLERAIGRLVGGRHRFVPRFRPERTALRFLVLGALDVLRSPRRLGAYLAMLRGRGGRASLRGHYIAVQRPPEVDSATDELVFCHHCPDATVRLGKLTPVCLADFVRPLDGCGPREDAHRRWQRAVDANLGVD